MSKTNRENLKEVEISGVMTSCTRFIKPITIDVKVEDDDGEDCNRVVDRRMQPIKLATLTARSGDN